MPSPRIRIVKGSCWPCKKRRVKCDLDKPVCRRCVVAGTSSSCDYSSRLIRWSTRPSPSTNINAVVVSATSSGTLPQHRRHDDDDNDEGGDVKLEGYNNSGSMMARIEYPFTNDEQRAVSYFQCRVWPLLTTVPDPCEPPLPVAMQHRVVLLSMCVFATSHRYLQDGHGGEDLITSTRSECLQVLRVQVGGCSGPDNDMLSTLLFAVLLLYLHDGLVEGSTSSATAKHYHGALAILEHLGGVDSVVGQGEDSMDMLLSEFVSADLTTALLQERPPVFASQVWDAIDKGSVWWGRDPKGRCSLASVLKELADMAFYHDSVANGEQELSMDRVRDFEMRLQPVYAALTLDDLEDDTKAAAAAATTTPLAQGYIEPVEAFRLVRAFQQAALIYLYRVICGLPASHSLVQQHVEPCLDGILQVTRASNLFHCVIFPLYVAGAHAQSSKCQSAVADMVNAIYEDMRFGSVRSIGVALKDIWTVGSGTMSWADMFGYLSPYAVVF